jgi:hypothetical protein
VFWVALFAIREAVLAQCGGGFQRQRLLKLGEIAAVKIERVDAYDLHGTVVGY